MLREAESPREESMITTTTLKSRAVMGNDSGGFMFFQLVGLDCAERSTCGLPAGELAWDKTTNMVIAKIDDERPSTVYVIPDLVKYREAGFGHPNTIHSKL
jgi:hypothetical protein